MKKINKETVLRHIHSFAKTYVTVFLALYLAIFEMQPEGSNVTLFDWTLIEPALKWSFLSVLRNAYKLLTD